MNNTNKATASEGGKATKQAGPDELRARLAVVKAQGEEVRKKLEEGRARREAREQRMQGGNA